jgi:hypothetical protein
LVKEATRVFVSYRREDTRHVAGRLADRLDEHFHVFMDIDTIEPGMDFTETIRNAVTECDVFVAVIGNQWTRALDESGQRRLDDPNDWVTAETAAALQRGVPVIPVLVDGARMPTRNELPEALGGLASRQAVPLRHESFTSDASRLVAAIERRSPSTAHGQPDTAQLAAWDAQANQAAIEGRWAEAVDVLEKIKAVDGSYADVARKLPFARQQRRITELQADIRAQAGAGNWAAVATAGTELASLDPTKADPDGLVSRARDALADSRRRQLAGLFDKALQAEAAGRWNEAADALQQISVQDPGNADIARRLAAVRARLGAGGGVPPNLAGQPPGAPNVPGQGWGAPTVGGDGGASRIAAAPPGGYPPAGPAGFIAMPPPKKKRSPVPINIAAAAAAVVAIVVIAIIIANPGPGTVLPTPSTSTQGQSPSIDLPSPTPSPTDIFTPSAKTELLSHIPVEIRDTCDDYTSDDKILSVDLVVAVKCSPTGTGAPKNVWYFSYSDTAAMKTAFSGFVKGTYKTGDCTKEQQQLTTETTEGGKKLPGGILKCYKGKGTQDTTFAWTHDFLHVLSFSDDPDLTFPQMKKWWGSAGPYRKA